MNTLEIKESRPESIKAKISKLNKGDSITVLWIDASQCTNVAVKERLNNHNVETSCVSSGLFYGIQYGELYHDKFILIAKNYYDSSRMSVESIPLCLVKEIDVFQKTELTSFFNKRKTRIRYSDGSVKTVLAGTLVADRDPSNQNHLLKTAN